MADDPRGDPAADPKPLNEYQRRHLYHGLAHLEKLFTEIEGILAAAGTRTLFPRYIDDVPLAQRKLLEGSLARLRAEILRLLESLGMRADRAGIDASGAIRTHLIFAEIAAEELGPSSLRGYGDLDPDQAREVEGIVAELRNRVAALLRELSPEPAAQLEARIAALPPSPSVEVLRALERLSRERGLMEFRPGLALVADRMAAPAMEIAVFGRVSCGKSSLLNYLIGAPVLPTGPTPITAVPTRIGYGPTASLTAQFERAEKTLPLDQLAAFASEQGNPDNRLGITRLSIAYPSAKLRPGVIFVDTPGLGSIRGWGAMETLAYLPRSDMAILLVDAGSTLGGDELELLRWLHGGGIPVQVALSKADLIDPADLERGLRFTTEVLARELRGEAEALPVRAVSVRQTHWAEEWFDRDIQPLYDTLRKRFQSSMDRRLLALRDGIARALGTARPAARPAEREAQLALERQLRLAEAAGERARDALRDVAERMADAGPEILDEVAAALEAAWQARPGLDPAAAAATVDQALGAAMLARGRITLDLVAQLGATYAQALGDAARAFPGLDPEAAGNLFAARDFPLPESDLVSRLDPAELAPPRLQLLGRAYARRRIRARLELHAEPIGHALRAYGAALQRRALASLAEMQRLFQAHADIFRAGLQRSLGALDEAAPPSPELQDQIRELLAWQPAAGAPPTDNPEPHAIETAGKRD